MSLDTDWQPPLGGMEWPANVSLQPIIHRTRSPDPGQRETATRLATFVENRFYNNSPAATVAVRTIALIHEELGCRVPRLGAERSPPKFFEDADIADVLDPIAIMRRTNLMANQPPFRLWRQFVTRVLEE